MKPRAWSLIFTLLVVVVLCVGAFIFINASKANSKLYKVTVPRLPTYEEIYVESDIIDVSTFLTNEQLILSPQDHLTIQGFSGKYYKGGIDRKAVEVIEQSLNISKQADGTWSVMGLISNEKVKPIQNVVVHAKLYNDKNDVIEQVSAAVPLQLIRSGEPAPFEIKTAVHDDEVKAILWDIDFTLVNTDANDEQSRLFVIHEDWSLAYGQKEYKGVVREAPYPYVLQAGFIYMGDFIEDAYLHIAWLNEQGQVIYIHTTEADEFISGIAYKGSASFNTVTIDDPIIAPFLEQADKIMWAYGK